MEISKQTRSSVSLGTFDGLHLGHRRLIEQTVALAKDGGWIPTVWSFERHPALFLGKPHPGLLMQKERKSALLHSLGIRREVSADFARIQSLSPEEFVRFVLCDELNAAHVVCGFNYTFGKNAEGDVKRLRELTQASGIGLTVLPPVSYKKMPISSSRIRSCLQAGQLKEANAMLGSPLCLTGTVQRGKQLGRTLGIPTANQAIPEDFVSLPRGVYTTRVIANGRVYHAITNLGLRPTVEGDAGINCESHLLGFQGDLYGQNLLCEFLEFLRPEQRFDSLEELKAQINLDIREVERYFENTP